jgi:hypothetical protein
MFSIGNNDRQFFNDSLARSSNKSQSRGFCCICGWRQSKFWMNMHQDKIIPKHNFHLGDRKSTCQQATVETRHCVCADGTTRSHARHASCQTTSPLQRWRTYLQDWVWIYVVHITCHVMEKNITKERTYALIFFIHIQNNWYPDRYATC